MDQKSLNVQKEMAVLLSLLPVRQKDVISKRFGLKDGKRKTLEEIGREYSITRERVRQIENDAKETLSESDEMKTLDPFFALLADHFLSFGGVRAEHVLFSEDAKEKLLPALKAEIAQAYLFFLLSLHDLFERHSESDEFHVVWALKDAKPDTVKESLSALVDRLEKHREPISRSQLLEWFGELTGEEQEQVLASYLAMSKQIDENAFGEYGLSHWPEIATRGVRDKAYLVLKKFGKPLHFREIVDQINGSFEDERRAHPQTVHNELIKNERFVLVGRGTYALAEWGYRPGKVADVLVRIFEDEGKPLSKEDIIKAVLKERNVKPNTIALNLQNRAYFEKMNDGRFVLKK